MQTLHQRRAAAPPISRLAGMRPTEADLGKATFTMPVTRWLEDGFGLYWGGVYALLADAPLASAIWTTLPAGKAVATSELSLSFVRPMSRKTTNIIGRAETIHSGSQVGLSMIQITDHEGRLLGFGSTRCLISSVPVDMNAEYPPPQLGPADPADPLWRWRPRRRSWSRAASASCGRGDCRMRFSRKPKEAKPAPETNEVNKVSTPVRRPPRAEFRARALPEGPTCG